jgi:glucose-6-phosphate 1-dehydrogenase
VELLARYQQASGQLPYERLLRDALNGDPSLFTRDDTVEAAWRVFEGVLDGSRPVAEYEPGTWGPPEAAHIAGSEGWHDPQLETPVPESAPAVSRA